MKNIDSEMQAVAGENRVGLKLAGEEITVRIVMRRREIYRFFP